MAAWTPSHLPRPTRRPRPWIGVFPRRRGARPWPLPLAIALLLALGGCSGADRSRATQGFGAGAAFHGDVGDRPTSGKYLQASLHGVEAVTRLAPSAFEERRAAAGNTLLVLDVSVLNRDTQPRVFSEGRLIAVSGDRERTFGAPLDMLSDGFLSLQVLEPSMQVRGRIVYEVPRQLQGRLYWIPGDGDARIALEGLDLSRRASAARRTDPRTDAGGAGVDVPQPAVARAVAPSAPSAPAARGPETATPPAGKPRAATTPTTVGKVWSGAGRWPWREGPAFECANAWKRVEHIICSDETLANMDWELNRAYAIARGSVQDRAALERQEKSWRLAVRDECQTRDCVEAVYERRIGELYSMARK